MMTYESTAPLIGRDADLAAVEGLLDNARRGQGCVCLIGGQGGMGKTRLAREFVPRAEARGATVLWGGCSELDLALPFLPFNEAIGTHLASADVAGVLQELGPLADAVTAIVPQLSRGTPQPTDLSETGARLGVNSISSGFVDLLQGDLIERERTNMSAIATRIQLGTRFNHNLAIARVPRDGDVQACSGLAKVWHHPTGIAS